ncbi:MAG: hypothetical protein ABW202_03755 [Duganella sp.]
MGRTADSSGSSGGATPVVTTVITAGEDIQRGDLILQGTDGKGYYAARPEDSALDLDLRPPGGGAQISNGLIWNGSVADSTVNLFQLNGAIYSDKLKNGHIVISYVKPNADQSFQSVFFSIINPDAGVLRFAEPVPESDGQFVSTSVVALSNGGFAIGFKSKSKGYIAVYDQLGTLIGTPFLVEPNTTVNSLRIAQLQNDNLAMISAHSGHIRVAIHTPQGVAVQPSFLHRTSAAGLSEMGDKTIGVAALRGGGFAIAYSTGATGNFFTCEAAQFDNAGTPQGKAQSIGTSANGNSLVSIVALTNGGYATATSTSIDSTLCIFNAAGKLQRSPINLGPLHSYTNMPLVISASPSGQVGVVYSPQGNAGTMAAVYSADATVFSLPHRISDLSYSSSLSFNPDGNAYVAVQLSMDGNTQVLTMNSALYSTSVFTSFIKGYAYSPLMAFEVKISRTALPCFMMLQANQLQSMPLFAYIIYGKRQEMSLIGVATMAAAKDAPLSVQITGPANLRRPFKSTWTINKQGSSPPGQRMYAVGSVAVLQGPQSPDSSNLN